MALVVLCVLAYLPGLFSIPAVDRDESRFAQASKQMLGSGTVRGWVVPMVGETPRLNKPPVIYWLQAGSAAVGGVEAGEVPEPALAVPMEGRSFDRTGAIGWFRVPSAVCAAIAALCTWRIGLSMFGARHGRAAWLAGALLATSLVVMWDARQARADQLLMAVTTAAMWALWECWREGTKASSHRAIEWKSAVWMWVCIGLGVMSKGPITPMIAALTAATLCAATGRWRWLLSLRPIVGVLIVAACVAPWVALVAREVGWGEYLRIIGDEVLGRSVSPSEGHWGPPGYHLVLLPLMFWPGSLLTAAGIVLAWKQSRRERVAVAGGVRAWLARFSDERPGELFLLAWLVPSWIVFELVSTKLPHYVMPLYPALALVSARAVMLAGSGDEARRAMGLGKVGPRVGFALWCVLGLCVTVGVSIVFWRWGGLRASAGTMMLAGTLIGASAGSMVVSAMALWRGGFVRAQCYGVAAMIIGAVVSFGIVLPRLHEPWVTARLAEIIERADPRGEVAIGAVGYHEDSLKFMTDGRLSRLGLANVPEWLAARDGAIVVLPAGDFEETRVKVGRELEELGRTAGFNYSKGERVELVVVRVR